MCAVSQLVPPIDTFSHDPTLQFTLRWTGEESDLTTPPVTRPLATRNTHTGGSENQRTNTLKPSQTVGMATVNFPIMILTINFDFYLMTFLLVACSTTLMHCADISGVCVFCFYPAVKDPVSSDALLRKEQLHVEPRQKLRVYYQVKTERLSELISTLHPGAHSSSLSFVAREVFIPINGVQQKHLLITC